MAGGRTPLDRLRSDKKPLTRKVPLSLDEDVALVYAEAKSELEDAAATVNILGGNPSVSLTAAERKLEDAQAAFDVAREAMEASTITFTLRSLSRSNFEFLLREHGPTMAQTVTAQEKGTGVPDFNPETLPPALIAACVVDLESGGEHSTDFGLDDAKALWNGDEWGAGETTLLFETAFTLCQSRRVVDLKKG